MSSGYRWTLVDKILMSTRPHLKPDDACFYYLQKDNLGYGRGNRAEANQMIINFKHDPCRFGPATPQAYYKRQAIREFAGFVMEFFHEREWMFPDGAALIPIPTSKPRSDESHDHRMDDLCSIVSGNVPWVTYLPALDTISDLGKTHAGDVRRNPEPIARNIAIASPISAPVVVLIDDVLTTGAHFAACKSIVERVDPGSSVIGLFLSIQVNDEWIDPR